MLKYLHFLFFSIGFFCQAQVWQETTKAIANDLNSEDRFGWSIGISGDFSIIGAPKEDEDSLGQNTMLGAGSAYVFQKQVNQISLQVQKLVALDRSEGDQFGFSVAINDDNLIISAPEESEDALGNNSKDAAGSAYLFKRNHSNDKWNHVQKVVASDRSFFDKFGHSVSIDQNYAIIGSHRDDDGLSGFPSIKDAGSVFIFQQDNTGIWVESQKIVASDREQSDLFGQSVANHGNIIVVGSPFQNKNSNGNNDQNDAGAAYVFEKQGNGNWIQIQKLVASDRGIGDEFGRSVSVSDNFILIGAHHEKDDSNGLNSMNNAGSAYLFKRNQNGIWDEVQKLIASDRTENDLFGTSVSIQGSTAVIGAWRESEDPNGTDTKIAAGSVYIFKESSTGKWVEIEKLVASSREENDLLGYSVSIDNQSIIAGAWGKNGKSEEGFPIENAGAAFIFDSQSATNINSDFKEYPITVSPNPTNGKVTIEFGKTYPKVETILRNSVGQLVLKKTFFGKKTGILTIEVPSGIYFLEIDNSYEKVMRKIIFQN